MLLLCGVELKDQDAAYGMYGWDGLKNLNSRPHRGWDKDVACQASKLPR